jgi:hypothetical protein
MTKFQKERMRQQRAQEKLQKRVERKDAKSTDEPREVKPLEIVTNEEGEVQGFDFHDFGK